MPVVHRGDPRAAECPQEADGAARGGFLWTHRRKRCREVGVWCRVSPGRTRVAVRWPAARSGRDRRWPAMPRPWRCPEGCPLAPPARRHTGFAARKFGGGIVAAAGAAAVVGWATGAQHRFACGPCRRIASLAFSVGHRPVADRLSWHGPLRSVTSRNPGRPQARWRKRQLSLPVSTMSQ